MNGRVDVNEEWKARKLATQKFKYNSIINGINEWVSLYTV